MKKEFRRTIILSERKVMGSYKFDDLFNLLPPPSNAPKPPVEVCHHPCVLEYNFNYEIQDKNFPGGGRIPDGIQINDAGSKCFNEIILLLSTFTENRFFIYRINHSWFIPIDTKNKKTLQKDIKWGQQWYHVSTFNTDKNSFDINSYKKIDKIDPNIYYNRFGRIFGGEFDLPLIIDNLFSWYYELNDEAKDTFLTSCSLFNQGLEIGFNHPSLSFSAFVSAFETLIHFENKDKKIEICNECGKEKHHVTKKFKDFMVKYGSDNKKFKEYASKIYNVRSKILHRGELFLGEVTPLDFGSNDILKDFELTHNIVITCRICLVNWLIKNHLRFKK